MNRQFVKSVWTTFAAVLILPAAAAWAQTGAAGGAATKVGVINIRQAIVTTSEGKQASAQLQTQFNPQQTDLESMQKQLSLIHI